MSQIAPTAIVHITTKNSELGLPAKIPRSCATHDGNFHADEVTACALLLNADLIDFDKIMRTRNQTLIENAEYILDVGGSYNPLTLRFDHHQIGYSGPLSSAGMVLRYLRDRGHLSAEQYHLLDDNLIVGVDDHDNGRSMSPRGICTFSHIISNFMPPDYAVDERETTNQFFCALTFVKEHIERMLQRQAFSAKSRCEVMQAMKLGKYYLLFDHPLPWIENFFALGGLQHPARFVIMATANSWKLRAIPRQLDRRMDLRQPMPEKWAGRMGEDFKKVSGLEGGLFCHKGRFISVWKTRENAIAACKHILSKAR